MVYIQEIVLLLGRTKTSGFSVISPADSLISTPNCRQLHQRKQNYEIYKFLKFQLQSKTKEFKKLKEQERNLKKNKAEVKIYKIYFFHSSMF